MTKFEIRTCRSKLACPEQIEVVRDSNVFDIHVANQPSREATARHGKIAPTVRQSIQHKRIKPQYGFSLIEVLLSLGIMSVALLIVFAILTPFLTQTGEVIETTTVNRITDRISAEVEQLSFDELVSLLNLETGLFASRMGDRLVLFDDPELDNLLPEEERYFAISLSRMQDISPASKDSSAGFLAFQIKIERLIHAPDGSLLNSPLNQTLAVFNTAVLRTDS